MLVQFECPYIDRLSSRADTKILEDKWHDHFGGVPGRYANRIKNASFVIDDKTYKVDANEHGGCEYPIP